MEHTLKFPCPVPLLFAVGRSLVRQRGGKVGAQPVPGAFAELGYGFELGGHSGNPRGDVLTGLAEAAFPDGSRPEVIDVVRAAANLFSAGQETTVRLLSSGLKLIAEDPEL